MPSDIPPPEIIAAKSASVACDGSGEVSAALGHPRVYLRIDPALGFVECGYCDRRFVLEGAPRKNSRWNARTRRFLNRTLDPTRGGLRRAFYGARLASFPSSTARTSIPFEDAGSRTATKQILGFGCGTPTARPPHAQQGDRAAAIERAAANIADRSCERCLGPRSATNQAFRSDDPDLVPFADKVALCQRIDAAARARDPRVAQVSVTLSASWSVIDIVRADGFVASDVRPLVRLGVSIVAEQDGRRETGSHGLGGRYLYDSLFAEEQWNEAIDIALAQARLSRFGRSSGGGDAGGARPGWPGVRPPRSRRPRAQGRLSNRQGNLGVSGRTVSASPHRSDGDRRGRDLRTDAAR